MNRFALLFFLLLVSNPAQAIEIIHKNIFPSDDKFGYLYWDLALHAGIKGNVTKTGGQGPAFNMGYNLGKHFSDHSAVIIYAGFSALWGNPGLDNQFVKEASASYQYVDSPVYWQAEAFANGESESGFGWQYGFLIKPFYKYVPPIKLYRKFFRNEFKSNVTQYYVGGATVDHEYLERSGWGMEIILFRGSRKIRKEVTAQAAYIHQTNIGYVSLFLDVLDFQNATIPDRKVDYKFSQFMNNSNLYDKFATEIIFGIRFGALAF